jgi:hypothetical protein
MYSMTSVTAAYEAACPSTGCPSTSSGVTSRILTLSGTCTTSSSSASSTCRFIRSLEKWYCHALVQVRVAEARFLSIDGDACRRELAGVEDDVAELRLLGYYLDGRLSFDLLRREADVKLEMLFKHLERVARRSLVRGGGDLEGRRHGGAMIPG